MERYIGRRYTCQEFRSIFHSIHVFGCSAFHILVVNKKPSWRCDTVLQIHSVVWSPVWFLISCTDQNPVYHTYFHSHQPEVACDILSCTMVKKVGLCAVVKLIDSKSNWTASRNGHAITIVTAAHCRRQKSMGNHHSRGVCQSTPTIPGGHWEFS